MSAEIVKSNKGKSKLVLNGFVYHSEKKYKEVFYWKCEKRNDLKCNARVTTVLDVNEHKIKKPASAHSHDPMAYNGEIYKTNADIKQQAEKTNCKPSQIINSAIVQCKSECRVYVPKSQNSLQKIKRVRSNMVKEPSTLDEINIPEDLKNVEGETFLLSDKSFMNERILIFGSVENLKVLGRSRVWLMDGTFKIVPTIMRQLFTIHAHINEHVVPVIYCVMSSKSKQCYDEVFYEILRIACDNNVRLSPDYIISDFEKAIISVTKSYFPSVVNKGCFFHFGQILWRKVQSEKLASIYGKDENFSLQIRMLKCLAFLQPEEIPQYYYDLKKSMSNNCANILKWMEKHYITGVSTNRKGRYSRCKNTLAYPPSFWSIHEQMDINIPTTQNTVEAWHRRMQVIIDKNHVGVYKLVHHLKEEYIVVKNKINLINSQNLIKPKLAYQKKKKNILTILSKKEEYSKTELLKNLAYYTSLA